MLKRLTVCIMLVLSALVLLPHNVLALKIAFPSYIYPNSEYGQIISSSATDIVMFNPASGPGSGVDPGYTAQLAKNKAAGKKTYGYLGTGYFCAPSTATDPTADSPYANRCPMATIRAGIDQWASFYPGLDGIFFDEADSGKYPGSSDTKQKWDDLISYASSKGLASIVNIGTDGYDTSLDALNAIIVNFEGPASTYLSKTFSATGPKYMHIVYLATTDDEVQKVAIKASGDAGFVHISNFPQQSGAYTMLPTNWAAIVGAVSGQTGTPVSAGVPPSSGAPGSSGPPTAAPTGPSSPTTPTGPSSTTAPFVRGPDGDCKGEELSEANCGIIRLLNDVFSFVSGFVVLAVIGSIILAGIQYSMAQGDPSNVVKAKNRILQSLVAFLMYMTLAGFIQWLIPGGAF